MIETDAAADPHSSRASSSSSSCSGSDSESNSQPNYSTNNFARRTNSRSNNNSNKDVHEDASNYANSGWSDRADHSDQAPNPFHIWQHSAGLFVMIAGVVIPTMIIGFVAALSYEGIWRMVLLHPIETLLESLLVLLVPYANYKCWHALVYRDHRKPVALGILNGIAFAVPLISLAVAVASFVMGYPLLDTVDNVDHRINVGAMGITSLLAAIVAAFLTNEIRANKITRDAKARAMFYSLAGMVLTFISFIGAEARPTQIRIAESLALSDNADEKENGLQILRSLGVEREIKMNCADIHTAGLAGMFLPLNADAQRRLYFAATGKPYRDRQNTNMSLMSNDYLRRHVVGAPVEGLSLYRSAVYGELHPKTLSSTLDWTFVFKNKTYSPQEARAEIALPEGSVISDLTLWIDGQPRSGAFSSTETDSGATSYITEQHRDPALITDIGRGRYLLQVSPVPGRGEMKVKVTITEPLKIDGSSKASVGMPHFIDTNFATIGQHHLRLKSDRPMLSGLKSLNELVTVDGDKILAGNLSEKDITDSTFSVRLKDPVNFKSVAAIDQFKGGFVISERKEHTAQTPKHLVVVVDASESMKGRVKEIVSALNKIPAQVKTSIVLAGDKDNTEPVELKEGIKQLIAGNFGGGQDNLHGIVKAAELAGENKGGAVLWIHGPQPGFNNEMYIMAPYAAAPKFYEYALDDCLTDANEFFKNHREIGPFAAVERGGPLNEDLDNFLSKWQPGATETVIESKHVDALPQGVLLEQLGQRELAILNAAKDVKQLLAAGQRREASEIGVRYHIVTPVSGAVVLENAADYRYFGMEAPKSKTTVSANTTNATDLSAPMLQGAVNGTVSPQGGDATVIYGINTAGTVRVNNLANLEAVINIFANGSELLGVLLGGFNMIMGALGKSAGFPFPMGRRARFIFGTALLVVGIAVPGMLNWMVASARDANLFD